MLFYDRPVRKTKIDTGVFFIHPADSLNSFQNTAVIFVAETFRDYFKRFAVHVWGVSAEGKTDEETALAGLDAMKAWMQEIGLVLSLRELGTTEEMLDGIAEGTFLLRGGYKPELTTAEVREILAESM